MKTIKYLISAFVIAAMSLTSCVGDLDVTPIDPNLNTADKALTSPADYKALLTEIYTGFATSGPKGPDSDCHLQNIDGGYSQYIRGLYHLNGLTTDEAVCGWDDKTLADMHKQSWTVTDVFVYSFYVRVFYQISVCNEFLRQANAAKIDIPEKALYCDEARVLRALCYWHAIDNFGNVPFADETSSVGATAPNQISRTELFNWLEGELKDLIDNSALPEPRHADYGRADKGLAMMILAKLYLNAEVYTGTAHWEDCANVCKKIMNSGYTLHSDYQALFMADNNKCTDEIIFPIQQDVTNTKSYGATTYFVHASTGGDMDPAAVGIMSGWGGIRTTPEFYDSFATGDKRSLFYTSGAQEKDIVNISDFKYGYGFMKYKNLNSDGSEHAAASFVDIDYPMFRYADALLMLAEAAVRGGAPIKEGLDAFNLVHTRAGLAPVSSYTADDVLVERGCELYQECNRRTDLVRFHKFTGGSYLWQWKGGEKNGVSTESYRDLFPIPYSDLNANANLKQNPGYGA